MENESFERALEPQPSKRKRSSILKPAEKRVSRDSRTVSFNERCIYKELHQDGTCDITNLFLRADININMMDIVEPVDYHNQTINNSMDMSMDLASLASNNHNNCTVVDNDNRTLTEEDMIEDEKEQMPPPGETSPLSTSSSSSLSPQQQQQLSMDMSIQQQQQLSMDMSVQQQLSMDMSIQQQQSMSLTEEPLSQTQSQHTSKSTFQRHNQSQTRQERQQQQQQKQQQQQQIYSTEMHNNSSQMDLTLISQFMKTMPKVNNIDLPSVNYDVSTVYEKNMSLVSDISGISSLGNSILVANSTIGSQSEAKDSSCSDDDATLVPQRDNTTMMTRISEISSFNNASMSDQSPMNETFFGAFHDSNNISIQSSRTSGMDTLMHNIDALSECIHKVDEESEECRRKLDKEMEELFKFYRHVVNKDNKYELAIRIFGLRYSLWLIIKVNPETYPNEKLNLKFAVNKKDRHLYPFAEYAEAVRRCTKEGKEGYLTKFVINAQKFRRFLRIIGYRRPPNK